jgi:hypothetical protein
MVADVHGVLPPLEIPPHRQPGAFSGDVDAGSP